MRLRRRSWFAILVLLLVAICYLALTACGDARPQASTLPAVEKPTPATAADRLTAAQAALRQAHVDVQLAQAALDDERTAAAQEKVWWFAGFMGVLALASAGLAIFVPSIARWAVRLAIAAAAVGSLAVFAAWLLPYLWWIGGGLSLIGIVGTIIYWRLDAKSRDQVLHAVDEIKAQVPNYKTVFRQHVDHDADKAIDAARTRLGLK